MNTYGTLLLEPIREIFDKFRQFAPNLLAMLTILVAGLLLARFMRFATRKILSALSFDSWFDRMGFTVLMRKGDVWARPTELVARVVYWFFVIFALMVAMSALNMQPIDNLVAQFFLYLPRVLSAVLILFIGYLVAGFLSRAVLIAVVNSGYHSARLLAEAVRLLVIVLILAMSLEQLQVAPNIVTAAFSIIFGGIVVALAIAFGVGGINAARRIIEKSAEERKEERGEDIQHL